MYGLHRRAVVLALIASHAGLARADHDMAMAEHRHGGSGVSLGLALQAAEFETRYYVGSYQGIAPSVGWMTGRFGASAAIGL